MHDRYSKLFRYLQLGLDLAALNAAFLLAGALRFDDLRVENQEYYNYYVQLFVFMNISWVLVASLLKSHIFYPTLEIRKSLARLFNTILIHAMVVALLVVSLKGYYYSRLFFTYFFMIFVPLVFLMRIVIINSFRNFLSKESNARPVLLLGDGPAAKKLIDELKNHPEFGLRITGWFTYEPNKQATGQIIEAENWLKENTVAEIYCALDPEDEALVAWQLFAERNLLRFRYLPNLGLKNITNAGFELIGEIPVLVSRKEPLEYRHNRLLKRLFDVLFSSVIILTIFTWLFPILALAIKFSSSGPIFFKQERSGINNQIFKVLKFRTMRHNTQANTQQAWANDERITDIGHFLRKHNLDELPQFFNVLWGHMSVVGPRPHMLQHTSDYRKIINEFMVRHLIKPGITGLAQSRGLRGETADPEKMRNRVKADVYYLENWSLLLDFKIIIDTVWNMLRGKFAGK